MINIKKHDEHYSIIYSPMILAVLGEERAKKFTDGEAIEVDVNEYNLLGLEYLPYAYLLPEKSQPETIDEDDE